jgi:non-specific serine/threonine protein kinase/serine/threonine-protein kinase
MGQVWLAEQTEPIRRQVALKVIKAGMDSAQVVARFEAERQALALMDHPVIATVFDGGTTPQGRPYFAMEFVKGEPITAYCDRHRLGTRQRLELFTQVCEGVQHAHQKGVIHRDLKPSNVLVTIQDDRPVPKIIDFGVAKATAQHLTERSLFTELGVLIGTPEYMSPEQAEMGGLDIDTRTDIYALGALLYELLTGALPLERKDLRQAGLTEIQRLIREREPPRPSTRVTQLGPASAEAAKNRRTEPRRLAGELRGDLDWIAMRALEKDRTRRYQTANALAADVRRHLNNEPVSAGPPSAVYRAGKFVRRHRVGVAAAATLVLLLAAFSAAMAVQRQQIARERDRANAEAETARHVSEFLVGLFKVSDPSEARGNALTARELLDNGARQIDRTLAAEPELQARLQATIATVYTTLGIYSAAEPLLRRAVAAHRRLKGDDSPDTLSVTSALADVLWHEGRFAEAEPLYRDIMMRRIRLLGSDHPDTLRSMFDLASTYIPLNELEKAEELHRRVVELQARVLGKEHPDTLATLNNLAVVLGRQGQYEEAAEKNGELLQIRRRVLGDTHPDTMRSLHALGSNYIRLGRYDEAVRVLLSARDLRRRVLGDAHPTTILTVSALAHAYRAQRRFDQAEIELLAAARLLSVDHRRPGPSPPFYAEGMEVDIPRRLVELYDAWGRPKEARTWRAKLAARDATVDRPADR